MLLFVIYFILLISIGEYLNEQYSPLYSKENLKNICCRITFLSDDPICKTSGICGYIFSFWINNFNVDKFWNFKRYSVPYGYQYYCYWSKIEKHLIVRKCTVEKKMIFKYLNIT